MTHTLTDVVEELRTVQIATLTLAHDVAAIRKLLERLIPQEGEHVQ